MSACLTPDQWHRLLAGELEEDECPVLEDHLETCQDCRDTLARRLDEEACQHLLTPPLTPPVELPPGFFQRLKDHLSRSAPPPDGDPSDPDSADIHFPDPPTERGPLGRLESYHIMSELGRGAFGMVYRAYDEQLNRVVALKVLRPEYAASDSDRGRFEHEARSAAGIRHEHVLTIHRVGHTPGFPPYIDMEYLDGNSLSDRLAGQEVLEPREAAELVRQAALGLAAAHARGLIHRDVKPSNLMLVDDGRRVKLTDFGLARPVEVPAKRLTQAGAIAGTPPYMSPEQVQTPEEIDGRSDLYSLGIVLYESLTGTVPFTGVSNMDVLQQVVHDEPRPPRRLNDAVPRDLETICLKAMAKEPGRRYQKAQEMADDLWRWLNGEPIRARPIGPVGRLWRWSRRNPGIAIRSAVAVVLLVAVTTGAFSWITAARERERLAREEGEKARERGNAVVSFLEEVFHTADPFEGTKELSIGDRLDQAAARLDKEFADDPVTRVRLLIALGKTYRSLGLYEKAIRMLGQAQELAQSALGIEDIETLTAMAHLAGVYRVMGRLADAVSIYEETLKLTRAILGPEHSDTLSSMVNLAVAYRDSGRLGDALPLFEEALVLRRSKLGPEDPGTLNSMANLAAAYRDADRLADALPLFEQTLKSEIAKFGRDHPTTLITMNNLAVAYGDAGRPADALRLFEETLKLRAAKLGSDHPETLTSMHNLAGAYHDAGRFTDALPLLEETRKLMRAKLGPDHSMTLATMDKLAETYQDLRRLADALPLYEEVLELTRAKLGSSHDDTLVSMNHLAVAYRNAGRLTEAASVFEEMLKLKRAKLGRDHPDILSSINNLAVVYGDAGRVIESLQLHEEALKLARTKLGSDHPDTLRSMGGLAVAYQAAGRIADALALLEETLKLQRARLGSDKAETLNSMHNLASAYRADGRLTDALRLFEETLELRRAKLGPDHPDSLDCMNGLAETYRELGRFTDALPLHEETLKLRKGRVGPEHPDTLVSMNNLALTYLNAGRLADALPLFEETLELRKAKLGPDHPLTLTGMSNLAVAYLNAGRPSDALPLFEETLKLRRVKLGSDHPDTLMSMYNLGACLSKQGKFAEAELHLRELTIQEKKRPEHWSQFQTKSLLGGCLAGQKNYTEAEPLLLTGYDGMKAREKQIPAPQKRNLTEAAERLMNLYEAWAKPEKAAEWREVHAQLSKPAKKPDKP